MPSDLLQSSNHYDPSFIFVNIFGNFLEYALRVADDSAYRRNTSVICRRLVEAATTDVTRMTLIRRVMRVRQCA